MSTFICIPLQCDGGSVKQRGLGFESQTLSLQGLLSATTSPRWAGAGLWLLTGPICNRPTPASRLREHESNKQSFHLHLHLHLHLLLHLTHFLFAYLLQFRQKNLLSHKHFSINHTIIHHASHLFNATKSRTDCLADPEPTPTIFFHQVGSFLWQGRRR